MRSAARIFLYILTCVIAASFVSHVLRRVTGAYELSMALAHLLYLAALAWCIARNRSNVVSSPAPAIAAAVAAVGLLAALALLGAVMNNWSPLIGAVLMESTALGYYPRGADVPFEIGGLVWTLSMLALTGAAFMAGATFRESRGGSKKR